MWFIISLSQRQPKPAFGCLWLPLAKAGVGGVTHDILINIFLYALYTISILISFTIVYMSGKKALDTI